MTRMLCSGSKKEFIFSKRSRLSFLHITNIRLYERFLNLDTGTDLVS